MSNAQKTPQGRSLNEWGRRKALDQIQKTGRSLPCSVVAAAGAIITVNFEVLSDFTLAQIDVPLFGPQYVRYPMQSGDLGVVIAVDAQIGAMCGLGTGTADLAQPANLGALFFVPLGNKDWMAVDPRSVVIYGPNGVTLQDTQAKSSVTLTPDGIAAVGQNNISATVGDGSVTMDASSILASFGNATVTLNKSQAEMAFGTNSIVATAAGVVITSDGEQIMSSNGTSMQIAWGSNAVAVSASGIAINGVLTINGVLYEIHKHTGVSTGSGLTGGLST
jgi:hypothetical protein